MLDKIAMSKNNFLATLRTRWTTTLTFIAKPTKQFREQQSHLMPIKLT